MLDTKCDIDRRKILTIDSMKSFYDIYKSKRISVSLKIRTFKAYSGSVFLYNSELWTLTETLEKQINSFQRRLLRQAIDIRWPKVISNDRLYEKTGVIKWSTTIRRRRLNWLGHLMRLKKETPVRLALSESLKPVNRKVGRPCLTWMKLIEKDLTSVNIDLKLNSSPPEDIIKNLEELTENRNVWRNLIKDIITVNC